MRDLIAKGISLTVTGSNGGFYVTVDGKDAELTVNDGNTELAIVTAQNGGKLSLSNGTFSRVAVKRRRQQRQPQRRQLRRDHERCRLCQALRAAGEGYAYKKQRITNGSPTPIQSRQKSPLKKRPSRSKRSIRIAIRTTPETRRLRRTAASR